MDGHGEHKLIMLPVVVLEDTILAKSGHVKRKVLYAYIELIAPNAFNVSGVHPAVTVGCLFPEHEWWYVI